MAKRQTFGEYLGACRQNRTGAADVCSGRGLKPSNLSERELGRLAKYVGLHLGTDRQ